MEKLTCDKCNRLLKLLKNFQGDIVNKYCPVHKNDYIGTQVTRSKIGKYSGASKTPYGKYEDR